MHRARNRAFDMVKVFATFFILFHHYHMVAWMVTGKAVGGISFYHSVFQDGDFSWGYMVELFFLISGYLMLSYLPKIQEGMTFYQFYTRRAARILPLMAVSGVVCAVILLLYDKAYQNAFWGGDPSAFGVVLQALGVQSGWVFESPYLNSVTWYCSVLMLCYLMFYAIVYWSRRGGFSPSYGFVLMLLAGCGAQTYHLELPFLNSASSRGYSAFFAGVLLAMLMPLFQQWRGTVWACWAVVLVFAASWYKGNGRLQYMPFWLTCLLYPAILLLLQRRPLSALSRCRFWEAWSNINFSVYIWHLPFYLLLYSAVKFAGLDPLILVNWPAMLVCAVVLQPIGWLSYRFVEQPLHRKALQWFFSHDPAQRPDNVYV